jgi:3-isopropylmalate/(R)-2-methylmalate dehydratase small subunit
MHHRLFVDGVDMIGASLREKQAIAAFEQRHWARQPWVKMVASVTRNRLI